MNEAGVIMLAHPQVTFPGLDGGLYSVTIATDILPTVSHGEQSVRHGKTRRRLQSRVRFTLFHVRPLRGRQGERADFHRDYRRATMFALGYRFYKPGSETLDGGVRCLLVTPGRDTGARPGVARDALETELVVQTNKRGGHGNNGRGAIRKPGSLGESAPNT